MNGELTATDTIAIDTLAHQCPELGGMAVYQLEILRSLVFGTYSSTVYHCEIADAVTAMRLAHTTTDVKKTNKITPPFLSIIPNPNKGKFMVKGNFSNSETVTCDIYTSAGNIIYTDKLLFFDNSAELNLNIATGIYIVKIKSANATKIQKLVITK